MDITVIEEKNFSVNLYKIKACSCILWSCQIGIDQAQLWEFD